MSRGQEPINAKHVTRYIVCNSHIDTEAIDNNEAQADYV